MGFMLSYSIGNARCERKKTTKDRKRQQQERTLTYQVNVTKFVQPEVVASGGSLREVVNSETLVGLFNGKVEAAQNPSLHCAQTSALHFRERKQERENKKISWNVMTRSFWIITKKKRSEKAYRCFICWFEFGTKDGVSKLEYVPQLVAEVTVRSNTVDVKVNITTCLQKRYFNNFVLEKANSKSNKTDEACNRIKSQTTTCENKKTTSVYLEQCKRREQNALHQYHTLEYP